MHKVMSDSSPQATSHVPLGSLNVPTVEDIPQVDVQDLFRDENRINRIATHIIILGIIVGVISLGSLKLPQQELQLPQFGISIFSVQPEEVPIEPDTGQPLKVSGYFSPTVKSYVDGGALPVIITSNPEAEEQTPVEANPVEQIDKYTVKENDTVGGIALKFGLKPETIIWSNSDLKNDPHNISIGQELIILPTDGVYHQIGSGDTVSKIAAVFKADLEDVINSPYNDIDPENPIIHVGDWIFVPGGVRAKPIPKQRTASKSTTKTTYSKSGYVSPNSVSAPLGSIVGTGNLSWPMTGRISQYYYGYHKGIDIEADIGDNIYSADNGYIVVARWDDTGYGNTIIVDHGHGVKTRYAHLSGFNVSVGNEVVQGQVIGFAGITGRATGPHLHFEVITNGYHVNPMDYLP